MQRLTHRAIDPELCGRPQEIREGYASVDLETTARMLADDSGLIHGGFVFGLADHAAMLAINHPNVILGSAQVRFLKPVTLGDVLVAEAMLHDQEGNKKIVTVDVRRGEELVLRSEMVCFTPERHVLGGTS